MGTNHIFAKAEARVIKFYPPVGYIKSQHTEDESLLKGAWSCSLEPFFKYCPTRIFRIGEARHFKFRVLINT